MEPALGWSAPCAAKMALLSAAAEGSSLMPSGCALLPVPPGLPRSAPPRCAPSARSSDVKIEVPERLTPSTKMPGARTPLAAMLALLPA